MTLRVDHVVIPVPDLERAAAELTARTGLGSVPGGRHAGHGTANRIVPLGGPYLELVAVVDAEEAVESPFGCWVEARALEAAPAAVCLACDDLDRIAERLGMTPLPMERRLPDGRRLAWRVAGIERALADTLPFFIDWAVPDDLHPGGASVEHEVEPTGLEVELAGDVDALRAWCGQEVPGLSLIAGAPRVGAVTVTTATGTVTI